VKNSLIIRRGSKFLSYQNTTKNFLKNPKKHFFRTYNNRIYIYYFLPECSNDTSFELGFTDVRDNSVTRQKSAI